MATTVWSLSLTSEGCGDYEDSGHERRRHRIARHPGSCRRDEREPIFDLAATVSELLARNMADGEMPPGLTLNVNVASVPRGEIRGIAVTKLSPILYWRLRTEQGSDGLYYNKLSAITEDHPEIVEGSVC